MTLRAALLTPFAPPSVRGNAITVDRIARGLAERGLDVRVWDLSVTPEGAVEAGMGLYRPGLVHAFHAFRAGRRAPRLDPGAQRGGAPRRGGAARGAPAGRPAAAGGALRPPRGGAAPRRPGPLSVPRRRPAREAAALSARPLRPARGRAAAGAA